MRIRTFMGGAVAAIGLASLPALTFAHVVVTPAHVDVGKYVTFTISVPNERQAPVTGLRLAVPAGLGDVTQTVMPDWLITAQKDGDATAALTWTGIIPVGQRADFTFSAQVPARAGELDWKAYQTYADGTVVSWDQVPTAQEGDDDSATTGPYSVTTVSDDLAVPAKNADSNGQTLPLVLSIIAVVLSLVSIVWRRKAR